MLRKPLSTMLAAAGAFTISAALAAGVPPGHPAPSTVSPEIVPIVSAPPSAMWYTAPKSIEEWHKLTASYSRHAVAQADALCAQYGVAVEESSFAGVPVRWLTGKKLDESKKGRIILHIHGGGYVIGEGKSGIGEAVPMAGLGGWRVVSVDYRMAPDHPYPAAIDDAFAVYRELVKEYGAENIAVMGTSAGGAMTLILALQAIEAGVPVPGALIAGTPWADIDKIGDSYTIMDGVDNVLSTYDGLVKAMAEIYANGADLRSPMLSPVYAAEKDLKAFPPTLLVTGTRDLFLSNTSRMHKRLLMSGAHSELIVYEGLSHAQYYMSAAAPETADHYALVDRFLDRVFLKRPSKD